MLASACVMPGVHRQVSTERDGLAAAKRDLDERVRLLGIANESLDEQVARLVDEREDLLEERSALQKELARAQHTEVRLAANLRGTAEELAITAAALQAEASKISELQSIYDGLVGDLESEVAAGQIRIEQLEGGIEVGVSQDILFASGSARLSRDGASVLKTVAARLAPLDYRISVEGHTDNIAIRGELKRRYPTNWNLAGARAASVVALLVESGIEGSRLDAVSYGPFRPIADNQTPEGRAQNRRIGIRLRPMPPAGPAHSRPDSSDP
jgi:chemotaxis protein MotB